MLKQFTSTVYIVAKFSTEYKVLLHLHKKIGIWVGIGGHIEEGENPIEAAHREVMEETGLLVELYSADKDLIKTADVTQLVTPINLLEEKIPAYGDKPLHYHLDLIYAGMTKHPEKIQMEEKFGWFSVSGLESLPLNPETKQNALTALSLYNFTH